MVADERIDVLERRAGALEERLARLEGEALRRRSERAAPAPARPSPPSPAPVAATKLPPPPPRPRASLEDVLGGRVLAWAGGLAVLVGVVLLFAVAVSRRWIGEEARTVLAGAGALALGALGAWLHERRGRTEAALAATAASIAALFVTVAVASRVYALVPAPVGAVLALAVGAAATWLALRWRAAGSGVWGVVGGLLAPVLAGAPADLGTLALLWAAAAAATAVVVWQRWSWLSLAAFALTTAQWAAFLGQRPGTGASLGVLVAFALLHLVAALGYELRTGAPRLRGVSAVLLVLNALVVAVGGQLTLGDAGGAAWVGGVAAVHLALGVAALRSGSRIAREVAVLIVALGVLLGDLALGLALDGVPRAVAYAAVGLGLAALVRRTGASEARLAGAGLGGHLCLAIAQALVVGAGPAELIRPGFAGVGALTALLAVAAACFVSARLVGERRRWQVALDAVGLALVAYLTALNLDGVALALAWAGEAVALAGVARRGDDRVAAGGAAANAALALGHALAFEAPPAALVDGLHDVGAAALALGAGAVAALACGLAGEVRRRALGGAVAAVAALYLASTALVTAFQPGAGAGGTAVLDLGMRQQGQALLSVLWALLGTGALVVGLRRDLRSLRLGALGLLLVALGKVALYDLAALTSIYRVGSCIALGLLLLLGALVWQRLRPRPLPDLRAVPPGLR